MQAWWQSLTDQWRWIFMENLQPRGRKTFFYAENAPKNLTIGDEDLHRLLHEQETLVAAYSKIRDISPLAAFSSRLKSLYLNVNEIDDITPLAGLTGLELLNIGGNHIRDIRPLVPLADTLKDFRLNGNQISDIGVLSGFRQLEVLELAANLVGDMTPLESLAGLRRLNLNHNPVERFAAPDRWRHLQEISLYRVGIAPEILQAWRDKLPQAQISTD